MTYPDNHPRAQEILDVKAKIDADYKLLTFHQEESRVHFKNAMEHLKAMGEDNKKIHETLKAIAEKLNHLKGLIDSPTF